MIVPWVIAKVQACLKGVRANDNATPEVRPLFDVENDVKIVGAYLYALIDVNLPEKSYWFGINWSSLPDAKGNSKFEIWTKIDRTEDELNHALTLVEERFGGKAVITTPDAKGKDGANFYISIVGNPSVLARHILAIDPDGAREALHRVKLCIPNDSPAQALEARMRFMRNARMPFDAQRLAASGFFGGPK